MKMNGGIASAAYFAQFYSSRDWRFYKRILSKIISVSDPGPILDCGAGCGYLVEACHRWGLKCVGLEGSEAGVKIARSRCPDIEIRQLHLSEPFPFENGFFTAAILNQVIEHLEPPVADNCVREIYRVLQPGGALLVFSPSRFNRRERLADPTHLNMYSPSELRSFLSSKGFIGITPADSFLHLLGDSRLALRIMSVLFRVVRWERLSATANCIAYKPNDVRIDCEKEVRYRIV